MITAERYSSPEIASSDDAKQLLDTMDAMMLDLFRSQDFVDFYENEVGGWDLAPHEVPSWIGVRFDPGENTDWIVETFRTFDAYRRPTVVDDPLDTANNGVGSVVFSRRDGQVVQVIVHGKYVADIGDYEYSLELASSSISVRPLESLDELPTIGETADAINRNQWLTDMDRQ